MADVLCQIEVCTKERRHGQAGEGSTAARGLALLAEFRRQLGARGLGLNACAMEKECLAVCSRCPCVRFKDCRITYGNVSVSDVAEIIESHVIGGRPVERLIAVAPVADEDDETALDETPDDVRQGVFSQAYGLVKSLLPAPSLFGHSPERVANGGAPPKGGRA